MVRWGFAASVVLALALFACKEEWTDHGIHVLNPRSETDDTEPADDDPVDATTDVTTTGAALDAGADTGDARPADARADVRDATNG